MNKEYGLVVIRYKEKEKSNCLKQINSIDYMSRINTILPNENNVELINVAHRELGCDDARLERFIKNIELVNDLNNKNNKNYGIIAKQWSKIIKNRSAEFLSIAP